MWHELASRIFDLGSGATQVPATTTPGEVLAGILGAVAALIVALTGLMTAASRLMRRRSAPPPHPAPDPHPVPLNSNTAGGAYSSELEARNAALENFLIRLHFNPNRIVTGEEDFADAHFD